MNILEWLALPLLIIACITDLRRREIPDWISIVLFGTALVASAFHWVPQLTLRGALLGGALGTVAGLLLFYALKFGGGDAKLMAALGAVLGYPLTIPFLIFCALWMGATGGIQLARGKKEAPYGPAIALAFASVLFLRHGALHSAR
ncbi:MAG: prepilin peptidase [Candidatus Sumerlaeia bacterium]|nr:prepilin peptidase [Candidatus Sumerlaeia bacterium]